MSEDSKEGLEIAESIAEDDSDMMELKAGLGRMFDEGKKEEAVSLLISLHINMFLGTQFLYAEGTISLLKGCVAIESREEFVGRVAALARPYMDFKKDNMEEFGPIARDYYEKKKDRIKINEVLFYEVKGDGIIEIHLAEARDLDLGEVLGLVKSGFRDLAKIISSDEKVSEIHAISWIVGKNPKIMELLGFTPGEVVSAKSRKKNVPMRQATISREKFLDKYLAAA